MNSKVFFLVALLLCTQLLTQPVLAQTPAATDSAAVEEIQYLLSQDPTQLTAEEQAKIAPYLRPSIGSTAEITETPDMVNCFDYYTFGSVQALLTAASASTISGSELTFTGTLENNNPYPIVDGKLYVKILNISESADFEQINSYPVVAQFTALEDISIPANSSIPAAFTWRIPAYTTSGTYELNTFFVTSDRFNLLGLPFTDDVTGNKMDFKVIGEVETGVSFDKNTVTIAGEPFKFAAFPPHVDKDTPAEVQVTLKNTTNKQVAVPVTWELFNWSGERSDQLLDTVTEQIILNAGETKQVVYTATNASGAVSYVRATATYQDTESILNIRFIRDGVEEVRLNFPSIFSYPLTAGAPATLFSCVHSTNAPVVDDGELILKLTDPAGAELHTYTYNGPITGDMMGLMDTFTPDTTLTDFDLTATLLQNGTEVDSVTMSYRCNDLDPTICPTSPPVSEEETDMSVLLLAVFIALLLIGGVVTALLIMKHKKATNPTTDTNTSMHIPLPMLTVLILPLAAMLALCNPPTAEAKSVTTSSLVPTRLAYYSNWAPNYTTDTVPLETDPTKLPNSDSASWPAGLEKQAMSQVTYRATLTNLDTGDTLTDTNSVPVGTTLTFKQTTPVDTDISWYGTGLSYDSPYGHWVNAAGPLPNACHTEDYLNTVAFNFYTIKVYILLNINPPTPIITTSSNVTCDASGTCTINGAGPVTLTMSFPPTYGKFYYRYELLGKCGANNVPMRYPDSSLVFNTFFGFWEDPYWGTLYGGAKLTDTYIHTINGANITYNITATDLIPVNSAPSVPTITPNAANDYLTGSAQTFTLSATDPEGDTLRYGVDWDNDDVVDQWLPTPGYVTSGTGQDLNKTWATAGSKSFRVLAEDSNGARSAYVLHQLSISLPPASATLSGTNCTIAAGDSTCTATVTWNITNGISPYQLQNTTNGTTISTNVAGTDVPTTIAYGINSLVLTHNSGVQLGTFDISATCDPSSAWSGTTCEITPAPSPAPSVTIDLSVNPEIIRPNTDSTISWNISDLTGQTCTLTGPGVNINITTTSDAYLVSDIENQSTYTLKCTDGTTTVEAHTTVKILPNMFES